MYTVNSYDGLIESTERIQGTMTVNSDVPLHARTTTIKPNGRARGERGTGSTITIDLTDNPELLAKIREAAKKDDREPSKYLRRVIIQLDSKGVLIPTQVVTVGGQ
jgi:hypothetical protein